MFIPNNRRRQLGLTANMGSFKRRAKVEQGAELSTLIVLANFSRREQKLSGFFENFARRVNAQQGNERKYLLL